MTPIPQPASRSQSGFTLIEVSLAVGIASVALVSLLAILPQGLTTMKRATDLAIEARIHQQVISEISQTDWHRRSQYDDEVRQYDDQGIQLDNTTSIDPIYTARVLVPDYGDTLPTRIGGEVYRPYDATLVAGADEDEVQLIIVEISSSAAVEVSADFDNQQNWPTIRTYRATLTRMVDSFTASGTGP